LSGDQLNEFNVVFEQIAQTQDTNWDFKCDRKECYWNLWYPNEHFNDSNSCVSESLGVFKMTPNSTGCKGYWNYEDACGCKKGE
jgi:hypothetical protein